jgi:hypothetical protein
MGQWVGLPSQSPAEIPTVKSYFFTTTSHHSVHLFRPRALQLLPLHWLLSFPIRFPIFPSLSHSGAEVSIPQRLSCKSRPSFCYRFVLPAFPHCWDSGENHRLLSFQICSVVWCPMIPGLPGNLTVSFQSAYSSLLCKPLTPFLQSSLTLG